MVKRKARQPKSTIAEIADDKYVSRKLKKKRLHKASRTACPVEAWLAVEAWLQRAGAVSECLEVRPDSRPRGLGAFAKRDVKAGEVIFSVPGAAMLTPTSAVEDPVVRSVGDLLTCWGEKSMPELLIVLRLCRARLLPDDHFHAYAISLPHRAPGAASWSQTFRKLLLRTS